MSSMTIDGPWCLMMMITEDGLVGYSNFESKKIDEYLSLAKRGILRIEGGTDLITTTIKKIWVLCLQFHILPSRCGDDRLAGWVRLLKERPKEPPTKSIVVGFNNLQKSIRSLLLESELICMHLSRFPPKDVEEERARKPPPIKIPENRGTIIPLEDIPDSPLAPSPLVKAENPPKKPLSVQSIFSYESFGSNASFNSSLSWVSEAASPELQSMDAASEHLRLISVSHSPVLSPVSPSVEFGPTLNADGLIT